MDVSYIFEQVGDIYACPNCKTIIHPRLGEGVVCSGCKKVFPWDGNTWDFIISQKDGFSELWETWEEVQANGAVAYNHDPVNNLGIEETQATDLFAQFCDFSGRILDVGCGPQAWPSYFKYYQEDSCFVGVDPLIKFKPTRYLQIRAIAENLPFKNGVFNHVIFATSLDHFLDPILALKEASRVLLPEGVIDIWVGEKKSGTPKPAVKNEWYEKLERPALAHDLFHIKRFGHLDMIDILNKLDFAVIKNVSYEVDSFRMNHFFKVKAGHK